MVIYLTNILEVYQQLSSLQIHPPFAFKTEFEFKITFKGREIQHKPLELLIKTLIYVFW